MAHVSKKLSTALEGALAGGGDPATSPLYIFGPFLRLIVVAGVAQVTFGASLWLVILTIATVSAMYRLVMSWVVDGSGGSGLSEEEFGSWAVKINAGITFIEYTLTFLVSMAALVTFLADRLPLLNTAFAGVQVRTFVAIALSILTGWLVNRGPRVAAIAFGPATAAVLILLWVMIGATIWRFGFRLPAINWQAFSPTYIGFTFGGFARILAVMTGIEVFANLVAAYDGSPRQKSQKAFRSLMLIMGTTSVTMLIVGPAIFALADVTNTEVSVFTQTMDQLLPSPLPWIGTLIGVAVLLSASAASAQGLQNLFVGLRLRNYVPAPLGQRNQYGVAPAPVWLEVGLVSLCFLLFGTHEETYLAIYAAGVFILLSMTGWAAAKRLVRQLRQSFSVGSLTILAGTLIASVLTTGATGIIFAERFFDGAWTYFLFIPALYAVFAYFRRQLGQPTVIEDRLGSLIAARPALAPAELGEWFDTEVRSFNRILVPLDGSATSTQAIPLAGTFSRQFGAAASLLLVGELDAPPAGFFEPQATRLQAAGASEVTYQNVNDPAVVATILNEARKQDIDLIVMCTRGRSGWHRAVLGSVAAALTFKATNPLLLVRAQPREMPTTIKRILVSLDGSEFAERILPHAIAVAQRFDARLILLNVTAEATAAEQKPMHAYLARAATAVEFRHANVTTQTTVGEPADGILSFSHAEQVDLIMLTTHGHDRIRRVMLGSVADGVLQHARCPVFLLPVHAPVR